MGLILNIHTTTTRPLPLPDGVEDALEGLRLQHDVLHKVVRQVAQVNLADALGELHLNHTQQVGWASMFEF